MTTITDAFLHFGVSFIATLIGAILWPQYRWHILAAVLLGGFAKELGDLFVSENDLAANLFGTMTAMAGLEKRVE